MALRQDGFAQKNPRVMALISRCRCWLPPLNFITIHYAYFISVCLVSSLIFWASSNPAWSISYIDSLFLVVSAMTEAGLNTVNLSQMATWQQTLLFLLIIFGSSIWVSIWTVVARKHAFEQCFRDVLQASHGGSALSLPRLPRFLSSRRPLSSHSTQPRTVAYRLGSVDNQHILRPQVGRLGSDDGIPASSRPNTGNNNRASQELPVNPAHIVFAEPHRPNTGAHNEIHATSTAAQHTPLDNQPVHRNGVAHDRPAEGGKREFSMRNFLAHRASSRNAQFHDLTREEREHLGGCEYRALKVLSLIVPVYFILWQLLGCLALGAWINRNQPGPPLRNGIHPWWLGIFNGASAFNNSGMSLLDANMIPFQNSYFVLITMGLMILAGNTAYPIFLRLIVWALLRFLVLATQEDEYGTLKDTLKFILQYPRRVYTNLFPARATWWLLFMLVLLNSIDWVAFEVLNIGNPAIESIPPGSRVLDGLFQAIAVRSGGFYVVPIPSVYIGLQVLYVIMMYISVYPVVITMRHSNVYEERSLGIYVEDDISGVDPEQRLPADPTHEGQPPSRLAHQDWHGQGGMSVLHRALSRTVTWHGVGARPPSSLHRPESRISFISQQIHGQLAHDVWWLGLAILVIMTINTSNFMADPVNFSVFNVIFEVVSAYGCVGISVGVPYDSYSFCGGWHPASKLVLCAVMLRGRHRGLPVALDRAVRLPGEELEQEEEEDHRIRRSMMVNRRVSSEA
ncbi:cation transport protein-domain-containing protein [Apiosordaria backusii]|uniref:Potassium transport protein n=1 Tax=Apiosordaria backusii TaxID=314023 RepID=A0AA40AE73_9PEZI|nr:cation transport protein-domain-containing protein [Apiosordaria backusii]